MQTIDLFDKYTPDTNLEAVEYECGETGLGLFETYGHDLKTVQSVAKTEPRRVWTLVDGDDGSTVWLNGYWNVNRILYAITNECGEENEQFTCVDCEDSDDFED